MHLSQRLTSDAVPRNLCVFAGKPACIPEQRRQLGIQNTHPQPLSALAMWDPLHTPSPTMPFGLFSAASVSLSILMVLLLITAGQANKEAGESPQMPPLSQLHIQGLSSGQGQPGEGTVSPSCLSRPWSLASSSFPLDMLRLQSESL